MRSLDAGVVCVVMVAFATLSGCASSVLDGLIFRPDREVSAPPPGVRERWITTADGVRIHAWYAPASMATAHGPAAPVLVWSHGNGGNIADREEVIVALQRRGLTVLAYDYRGYGRSNGHPSEAGVYLDARAAYESIRDDGVPPAHIVCFGESLGAAVAVQLATEKPCAGLVLVSPFTTLADAARRHYGPFGALAGDRFDSLARITSVRTPMLMAHGDRDEIVPFTLGERLFAAAPHPKRFVRAGGFRHNDILAAPGLLDTIATFARAAAAGRQ